MPSGILPFARRQIRVLDQLRGYPASARRPGVVLMLHVGRCGSTVLANLLMQNPTVFWDGKLHRKALGLYGQRVKDLDIARWTQRQFSISGSRFYGFEFKILADQYSAILGTTTPDFLDICKQIGVTHYILLIRRNTLRHVVSHYASRNRGAWHASTADAVQARKFHLDTTDITTGTAPGRPLLDYLQEVDDAHADIRRLLNDQPFLEIEYETDIDGNGAEYAYHKVCDFLDIEPGAVSVRNVKVNPFPMDDVLENYAEVAGLLEGTEFAWMAED